MTRLGFGSAPIGNLYGAVPDAQALEAVRAALSVGANFLDTAPLYGAGLAETRLGRALAGVPRDAYTLQSKVGRVLEDGEVRFDFSEAGLERSLASSLARLNVASLDVVLLHDPDDFEREATQVALPTLLRWRDEGRVRGVGVGMNQWRMPLRLLDRFDLDVVMLAGRYTLLDPSGRPLLDACHARGVRVLAAGVFNSGVLAGGAHYDYAPANEDVLSRVRALRRVCADFDVPLPAAAIQFALAHPAVDRAVLGATSAGEVRANAAFARHPVPAAFWHALVGERLLPPDAPTPPSEGAFA